MVPSDTELAGPKPQHLLPFFTSSALKREKWSLGLALGLLWLRTTSPKAAAALNVWGERGRRGINAGLFCPWAGQEWLELLLWLPASHKSHFCIPLGIRQAGTEQSVPPFYFLGARWVQPKGAWAGLCRWPEPGCCSTWEGTGGAGQCPGSCRTGLSHELPQNTGEFSLSFPLLGVSVASKNPPWDWIIGINRVKMEK